MCQHNLPCSIVYAHCLLPGRAFASLYVLLFLEKEAEIGGRDIDTCIYSAKVISYNRQIFILNEIITFCLAGMQDAKFKEIIPWYLLCYVFGICLLYL